MINVPLLSVIIPTTGKPKRKLILKKIFSKIEEEKINEKIEIILVENSDCKGHYCASLVSDFADLNVRYYNLSQKSSSLARNYGVKKSRGQFLVFLDDDCIPRKSWFRVIEKLTSFSPDFIFQGKIIHKFKEKNIWTEIFLNTGNKFLEGQVQPWEPIDFLYAGNVFLNRGALEELEYLFDEKLFPFVGEQEDFAYRLKREGITILYAPELVVDHIKEKRTIWTSIKRDFLYGRRDGILTEKYRLDPQIGKIIREGPEINEALKKINQERKAGFNRFLRQETAEYSPFYKVRFLICFLLLRIAKRVGFLFGRVFYKLYFQK